MISQCFKHRSVVNALVAVAILCGIATIPLFPAGVKADDGGLSSLLSNLLSVLSEGSTGGCLGHNIFCDSKNQRFCVERCGSNFSCQLGNCRSGNGMCFIDSDCNYDGRGFICNSFSMRCSARTNNQGCKRDLDCLEGSTCDLNNNLCIESTPNSGESKPCLNDQDCARYDLNCVSGKCVSCSDFNQRCDDKVAGKECCAERGLTCRGNVCAFESSKGLGDSCNPQEENSCDRTSSLVCDKPGNTCLVSEGGTCSARSECARGTDCVNGKCQKCKMSGSSCLLGLGLTCTKDGDCESGKCDTDTRVCVIQDVKCNHAEDCIGKIPNPRADTFGEFCPDGVCRLCIKAGQNSVGDTPCCDRSNPINGKCSDGSESGDGSIECKADSDCTVGSQRCCLSDAGLPSALCGPSQYNQCVAWVNYPNGCCEGTETPQTHPLDCPQKMADIPKWCTPNIQAGGGTVDCEQACINRNVCGTIIMVSSGMGAAVNCDCSDRCGAQICYNNRCMRSEDICANICQSAKGEQRFFDSNGIVRTCYCGQGDADYYPEEKTVRRRECISERACYDFSCLSRYRCCNSSSYKYGDGQNSCWQPDAVQPEEGLSD